jgi:hypothetical protein
VEPQQQPRSTPPPPTGSPAPTPPPPPGAAPKGGVPSAPVSSPPEVAVCPACGQPRAEGTRYCEECGHDYGGVTAPEAEERSLLSGPALWVFLLFWIVLAIAGLWFLFSALWAA